MTNRPGPVCKAYYVPQLIVGLALIILVAVVCELALKRNRRTMAQRQFLRENGMTAVGTIVDTAKVKNSKSAPSAHYAKIEYFVKGKRFTLGNTWPLEQQLLLTKGTRVDVLYEKSNPSNACVGDSAAPNTAQYGRSVRLFEVFAIVLLALFTLFASR